MTIVKIYLDGIKYFDIHTTDKINIKKELPLSKYNQIYQFHIFYRSMSGNYKPIDKNIYFVYKDYDDERYLYFLKDKLNKIDDMMISQDPTIKIFMNTTKNIFIYNISMTQILNDGTLKQNDKYVFSESDLSKNELLDRLFHHHHFKIISEKREEYGTIIDMDIILNMSQKKNFIYDLKRYIHHKVHSIKIPLLI